MEPQEIPDQSIPLIDGSTVATTGNTTTPVLSDSGAQTPTTNLDQKFPPLIIAHETISQSLNTETKRILSDYTFESLGAFSVYSKAHPLAHISISGDGIAAVDANGNPTFTLDGETGDATFRGTVEAGGFTIADTNGIRSLGNFSSSGTVNAGLNQVISGATEVDITGSDYNITPINNNTLILFLFSVDVHLTESVGNTANGNIKLYIGSSAVAQVVFNHGAVFTITLTGYHLAALSAAVHAIKLTGVLTGITGSPSMTVVGFKNSFLQLGS